MGGILFKRNFIGPQPHSRHRLSEIKSRLPLTRDGSWRSLRDHQKSRASVVTGRLLWPSLAEASRGPPSFDSHICRFRSYPDTSPLHNLPSTRSASFSSPITSAGIFALIAATGFLLHSFDHSFGQRLDTGPLPVGSTQTDASKVKKGEAPIAVFSSLFVPQRATRSAWSQ
jgi:hypothetical protein